jgi:hypothetical protein
MKGILASICALALLSSVSSEINDLYYHHHPNTALAAAADETNNPNQGYARPYGKLSTPFYQDYN